jgi:WD40 repeat protein
VGILFISHSSADNAAAIRVRDWLKANGWGQVFLDLDPAEGIAPGHRWQQELKLAGERCSGVVVLLSPNWIASRWCQTEFLVADQLGKKIFPILIAPVPLKALPRELAGKFQIADISTAEKEAEGFNRLSLGLKRSGLDPRSFPWPPAEDPQRPIYRGLQSLDEQDAAIFFGRDAHITKAVDAMRRIRNGAPERVLVILGASGAGKSSFLKAGILARLRRDEENFLVLPVIRPANALLTGKQGIAQSAGCSPEELNLADGFTAALAKMRAAAVADVERLADVMHEKRAAKPPTIVIALDQAEELFSTDNMEAVRGLDLLTGAVRADPNVIIIATIRSNDFAEFQTEKRFEQIPLLPFSLPPIPLGAFKEIIEGPARLAQPPLVIDPALSDRLLQDLAAEDALPLLAFTLERLLARVRRDGRLTVEDYSEEMGGLQGAIVSAVDSAFSAAHRDPALAHGYSELEKLARAAFIPALVHLEDAESQPGRRVARLDALPETTRPLVRHLVDQRLLVCNRAIIDGDETETIEVVHEAILRQWPLLKGWIAEERDILRAVDAVRAAAADWRVHAGRQDAEGEDGWLSHRGGRLQEAEELLARPGFASAIGSSGLAYLAGCRQRENAELMQERAGIERTRRLQRNIGLLIAIAAAIVLIVIVGIDQTLAALAARTSNSLAAQAAGETNAGYYDRGARYALAGLMALDGPPIEGRGADAEAELNGAIIASNAIAIMRGHRNQVLGASFGPGGDEVVSASRDRTARIWNARTGELIHVLRGHGKEVMNASFNRNGTRIVTASADGTARIWDARTARQTAVLLGHDAVVATAAFSPDGRRAVTASYDQTVRVWDALSGRQLTVFPKLPDKVESAAFSNDGARIIAASDDGAARVWDANTGKLLATLGNHESALESAAFSPDGKRAITVSASGAVDIWDVDSAKHLKHLNEGFVGANSAYYSNDGTSIVTAGRDDTACVWEAESGVRLVVLRGHEDGINTAAFSPDGRRVVTSSDDHTIRIWNARPAVIVLRGHTDAVNDAVFSPDGKRIATASTDKTLRIWEARTAREIAAPRDLHELVESVRFSPDGNRIATASDDGIVRVWNADNGQVSAVLRGHGKAYLAVFSPDGKSIATASADGVAQIWDAASQRELVTLRHGDEVTSAEFSPDGQQIVTASADKTVRIWDSHTGREIGRLNGEAVPSSAVFNAEGTRIGVAYRDKTAAIWDASTFRRQAVLHGHEDSVVSIAFAPAGDRVVTAARDRTARVWDANSGRELAVLRGHDGPLDSAVFSIDGKSILTAADDGTARIWNAPGALPDSRELLLAQTCRTALKAGLSMFSGGELRAAPVLDPQLDEDACRPPGFWRRTVHLLQASYSRR